MKIKSLISLSPYFPISLSPYLLICLYLLIFLSTYLLICPRAARALVPGEGVTISPPLTELTINPGDQIAQTIKISNPTKKIMELYPVAMNFTAKGESGEPAFYPANSEEATFALANWIKFSQTKIAVANEQVVEWKYYIQVPKDAEPGGHYGVVFFATEPPDLNKDTSALSMASMIGSLILVKVPGDIKEGAQLKEFSTANFFFKPPVNFTTRIYNSGNIHFKPKGDIIIKNWRGKEVGDLVFNQEKGNILPQSTRKFEQLWSPDYKYFWEMPLGRFSANLNLTYGEKNNVLSGSLVFWIIPWWLIITVAIILVVFIVLIIRKIKKRRRKKFANQPPPPQPPGPRIDRIILR